MASVSHRSSSLARESEESQQRSNRIATFAFVCGLLSLVLAFIPLAFFLSFPLGLFAVVLAAVGWRRAIRDPARDGKGLAKAGLILAALGIGIAALYVVALDRALEEFAPDQPADRNTPHVAVET